MGHHHLPPIIKLSKRFLVEIEQAVRGFARYHKYALGADLRRQAMQLALLCHRAWRDRSRVEQWVEQLVWKVDEFFNSIHRGTLWRMLKPALTGAGLPEIAVRAAHALLRYPPVQAGTRIRATAEEVALVPPHKRLVNAPPGSGLPIGNLSSQFLANVYLDRLDQFVKHTLKAKRYLRYVDDFVLVHHDREQLLAWQEQITEFLGRVLHLSLKAAPPLRRLSDGIDFLGYVVRPTHTLVRRRVVAHMHAALAGWQARHVADRTIRATPDALQRVQATAASYAGHLKHASSHRLMARSRSRFPWLAAASAKRKAHHARRHKHISIPFGDTPA